MSHGLFAIAKLYVLFYTGAATDGIWYLAVVVEELWCCCGLSCHCGSAVVVMWSQVAVDQAVADMNPHLFLQIAVLLSPSIVLIC